MRGLVVALGWVLTGLGIPLGNSPFYTSRKAHNIHIGDFELSIPSDFYLRRSVFLVASGTGVLSHSASR
jgi:hypothetical protein